MTTALRRSFRRRPTTGKSDRSGFTGRRGRHRRRDRCQVSRQKRLRRRTGSRQSRPDAGDAGHQKGRPRTRREYRRRTDRPDAGRSALVDEAAVRTYAEAQQAAQAADAEAVSAEGGAAGTAAEAGGAGAETTAVETGDGERREPYRGVRRSIGEQMARSRREVPHATHHDQVVVSGLVEARERLAPLAEERDVTLTYTPFVVKCVTAALKDPFMNSQLDEENEEIVLRDEYNIGVATRRTGCGSGRRRRGRQGSRRPRRRDERNRRAGPRAKHRASEMQGGTFTVTNIGVIGGEYASPIINVPETAILGIGALKERPVAEDGEVVAKPTLPLSLALDHRVIDGADAARFVSTLEEFCRTRRDSCWSDCPDSHPKETSPGTTAFGIASNSRELSIS